MLRRTLVTLSAAAIAVTGIGSAPAAADNEDIARALAAIAGIAVIGTIIHKRNSRDDHNVTREHQPRTRPYTQPRTQPTYEPRPRRHVEPRPLPRRANRKVLPGNCLRTFDTRNGRHHMFVRRCLQRNNVRIERLPQHCAKRIRTYDGRRNGFSARCLRRAGYSLARR